MYDLLPDDTQESVIDSAREVAERVAAGAVPAEAWRAVSESGVLSLALREETGGAGLGATEEVLVLVELGAALVDPTIVASLLAAHYLADLSDAERVACPALTDIVSGELRVALAEPWSWGNGPGSNLLWRAILPQTDPHVPEWCVVASPDGITVALLPPGEMLPSVDPGVRLMRLASSPVPRLPRVPMVSRGMLLTSALQNGLARRALERAVAHAKIREQFGKPIGSFQAVKHLLARAAVELDAASATVAQAAVNLDAGIDDEVLLRSAAALSDRCAVSVVRTAIQRDRRDRRERPPPPPASSSPSRAGSRKPRIRRGTGDQGAAEEPPDRFACVSFRRECG
jgi:hypothetical protein